jgi:hypothetical protein
VVLRDNVAAALSRERLFGKKQRRVGVVGFFYYYKTNYGRLLSNRTSILQNSTFKSLL